MALAEGVIVNVASRTLAAPVAGVIVLPTAVTVAPKSATVTGAVTMDSGNCATSLFKSWKGLPVRETAVTVNLPFSPTAAASRTAV